MEVEELERGEISGEARAAAMADAPELAALLAELQGSLAEVRLRVGPLLKEVHTSAMTCWSIRAQAFRHFCGAAHSTSCALAFAGNDSWTWAC